MSTRANQRGPALLETPIFFNDKRLRPIASDTSVLSSKR
jgi:hypothetical protein